MVITRAGFDGHVRAVVAYGVIAVATVNKGVIRLIEGLRVFAPIGAIFDIIIAVAAIDCVVTAFIIVDKIIARTGVNRNV